MAARKLAITLEEDLADEVARAAKQQTDGNISAWLALSARESLRLQAMRELLTEYERAHGKVTDAEIANMERRLWPRR